MLIMELIILSSRLLQSDVNSMMDISNMMNKSGGLIVVLKPSVKTMLEVKRLEIHKG